MTILRTLEFEEVGELEPCRRCFPQPQRSLAGRWVEDHRPEQALRFAVRSDELGEEQRGHPVPAGGDHAIVLGTHLVVGGRVSNRRVDHARIETDLLQQMSGHLGVVGAVAFFV